MKRIPRVHLYSRGVGASCGQSLSRTTDIEPANVTCKFCRGILKLRLTRGLRVFTTQEWTRCALRGNVVWAQSANGVLIADDDNTIVVTSDCSDGKRYRVHRNTLMLTVPQ